MIRVKITPEKTVAMQVESLRGEPGRDGVSPQVTVERVDAGVRITAKDAFGETSAVAFDGEAKTAEDAEVLDALIAADLLPAVHDEGGILTDEAGAILLW